MPRIKPLKWVTPHGSYQALAVTGHYRVWSSTDATYGANGPGLFVRRSSKEEAVAACQARHEELILGELEPVCGIEDLPEYLQLPFEDPTFRKYTGEVVVDFQNTQVYAQTTVGRVSDMLSRLVVCDKRYTQQLREACRLALEVAKL